MAAATSALSPPSAVGGADNEDSNISSPLSDVDDKDTNDDDIEHMQLDHDHHDDEAGRDTPSPAAGPHRTGSEDGDDSDSALSEAQSDDNSDDNDTEAETERLYDTPRNPRQRNVTDDYHNEDQGYEHTPSKLRNTAAVDLDKDSDGDADSLSDDDASVASAPTNHEDPLKKLSELTDAALGTANAERDRKRKRSTVAEQSDPEQPSKKRPASLPAIDTDADEDAALKDEDGNAANPQSAVQSGGEDADTPQKEDHDTSEETSGERGTRNTRKITRNGAKRSAPANGTDVEEEGEQDTPQPVADDEAETRDGEAEEEEVEEENELAVKNADELERKQAAFKDWSRIEEMFGEFRDRLYKDRLQHLEDEEQSLISSDPTHPEFLNMKRCLDERLEEKLKTIKTEHEFRIEAHQRRAVAQRAQAWSQYFQAIREKREQTLEALNKEWYDVQSSRRRAHSLPDCVLLFPKDAIQRVRNAVSYNSEVSTLAGLAKYEGFPAGPEMKGASATELEDDFAAMEHTRRGQQKKSVGQAPREEFQAPAFNRLGPAGEQFLKDTPWANPNHSSHKTPQPSQPPQPPQPSITGRHDLPGSSRAPLPSSAPTEHKAPSETRAPAQRTPLPSRFSASPELTRPVLNQNASTKRANNMPNLGRGSKTAAA